MSQRGVSQRTAEKEKKPQSGFSGTLRKRIPKEENQVLLVDDMGRSWLFFYGILFMNQADADGIGFIEGVSCVFFDGNDEGQSAGFSGFEHFVFVQNGSFQFQNVRGLIESNGIVTQIGIRCTVVDQGDRVFSPGTGRDRAISE